MKILFVQKMNGVSGSELYLMQIMPELKRRGHDVQMLIIFPTKGDKNGNFIKYLADFGIPTHEIYGHGTLSPILYVKVKRLLDREDYDIVQSNLVHADFWITAVKFLFRRRQKVISVKHGYHPAYQARHGLNLRWVRWDLYYWVEKFASGVANYNVTISRGLYKVYVDGKIVGPSKIKNIYYGLTLSDKQIEGTFQVPADPYVLITGRLVSFKGHKFLIDAWKTVTAQRPELKLYIAGEGVCRKELESQVARLGLKNNIVFLGHVPNPHPLMKNCVFTVVSSIWEGFGLILLESWLHRKPIVAFDVSAMNEVIDDGVNGILVKEKDSKDLAEKILALYADSERTAKYGENGFNKLNSYYTLQRMTDEMEEVYNGVLNGRPQALAVSEA